MKICYLLVVYIIGENEKNGDYLATEQMDMFINYVSYYVHNLCMHSFHCRGQAVIRKKKLLCIKTYAFCVTILVRN